MPITADRVMSIIDLSQAALKVLDTNQNLFHQIYQTAQQLNALSTNEDPEIRNLILTIRSLADKGMKIRLDPQARDNLITEKAHFEINFRKNNVQKWRKRLERQGLEIPYKTYTSEHNLLEEEQFLELPEQSPEVIEQNAREASRRYQEHLRNQRSQSDPPTLNHEIETSTGTYINPEIPTGLKKKEPQQ